jgi:hypothetical protein
VHHFLVTFTIPQELRDLFRRHQRVGYELLWQVARDTIVDLAASSRHLAGCQLGFFGVLQTWARNPMVYHPHLHFVVPGGGVHWASGTWQQTPENFLFVHAAAINVYKGKMADRLKQIGWYDAIDPVIWKKKWNVDIKPVGNGQCVLKYLAPYVSRVAICDKRIITCDDEGVTFSYTPKGKRRPLTKTVSGSEFVRGFVQHTLPSGFQKIRYYGWMSPNCRMRLEAVRWALWLYLDFVFWLGNAHAPDLPAYQPVTFRCQHCGGTMRAVRVTGPCGQVLYEHPLPYLDSG